MDEGDLVMSKTADGKITSLGYNISSRLLKNSIQVGGSIFDNPNLAVPVGLANIMPKQRGGASTSKLINNDTIVGGDLYNNLLKMVEYVPERKMTRRVRDMDVKKRKTRRLV